MIANFPCQINLNLSDFQHLLMKQRRDYLLDGGRSFVLKRLQAEATCLSLIAFDACSLDRFVDRLCLPTREACLRAKWCVYISYEFLLCGFDRMMIGYGVLSVIRVLAWSLSSVQVHQPHYLCGCYATRPSKLRFKTQKARTAPPHRRHRNVEVEVSS